MATITRRMSWMIVREGDVEPEYFRGRIFGERDAFTRDPGLAFQFLRRGAAARCLRENFAAGESHVRIVPTWSDRID